MDLAKFLSIVPRGDLWVFGYGSLMWSPDFPHAEKKAGRVHGYLNRCAHVAMELDWQEGVFFDADGRDLICSTHGATYEAASGRCLGGPCNRNPLVKLRLQERDGSVYFTGFQDD